MLKCAFVLEGDKIWCVVNAVKRKQQKRRVWKRRDEFGYNEVKWNCSPAKIWI